MGAAVRDHRNAVRDRSESLSAINRNTCPQSPESAARAFVAKAVLDLPTTSGLLERLAVDATLRRLCGFERASQVLLDRKSRLARLLRGPTTGILLNEHITESGYSITPSVATSSVGGTSMLRVLKGYPMMVVDTLDSLRR